MIKKSFFIKHSTKSIHSCYNFLKVLGKGGFSDVYRVQNIQTGGIYACKKIKRENIINIQQFETELSILKEADHPNIVRLYDVFIDSQSIYLILEECIGGELFARLTKIYKGDQAYTENKAKVILKQILQAIAYLHKYKICHRDIKPQNIMFTSKGDDSAIKLIDFGLSKIFNNSLEYSNIVGTIHFMAPEVFTSVYNEKCDIWSCGIILYMILTGQSPFYSKDKNELIAIIKTRNYSMESPMFSKISEESKSLISLLLTDVNSRITATEALTHPWFKSDDNHLHVTIDINLEKLLNYSYLNIFQKSVVFFTSLTLPVEDTYKLAKLFKEMDTNCDGILSFDEILAGIKKQNILLVGFIDEEEVKEIISHADVDNNSFINYTEFISAMIEYSTKLNENILQQCFCNYDQDDDGFISFEELLKVIVPQSKEQMKELKILFDLIDLNKDNVIDYEEFKHEMNSKLINMKPRYRKKMKKKVTAIINKFQKKNTNSIEKKEEDEFEENKLLQKKKEDGHNNRNNNINHNSIHYNEENDNANKETNCF